jgi:hypothetical protein
MSSYQPSYEWQGGGFSYPKQVCAICGDDKANMNRLFWAGSYMNGDDEYVGDLCQPHKKQYGHQITTRLAKGEEFEAIISSIKAV